MAGVLPSVRGGSSAILPLDRSITYNNELIKFENESEVRYLDREPLDTFVLSYKAIPFADRIALDQFITAQRGSFDTTWTFPFKTADRVKNGNFALGFKNWVTNHGPGFVPLISQGGYSRSGETDAVYVNGAVTIPANSSITANFVGSLFSYVSNQVLALDLWATVITNASFPAGILPRMQFGLFASNSSLAGLGTVSAPTSISGPHNWAQVGGTLPPNSFVSSNVGQVVVDVILSNTTSLPISIPFNAVAFAIAQVRVFDPFPEAGVYTYCTFEDDKFTWTLNRDWPRCEDGSIKCRQTRVGGQAATGVIGPFPTFGPFASSVTGYPYVTTDTFCVARNDFTSGPRTAYGFTGTAGNPSRPLRNWTLTLSTLNDLELGRLESHFLAAEGSWKNFGFTDPLTGKGYTSVRYDMDALSITHIYKGLNSVTVRLAEAYGSSWTA